MNDTVIKVSSITLVREKRLRGGKTAIRNAITIREVDSKPTSHKGVISILAVSDTDKALVTIKGTLDTEGNVRFDVVNTELRGYTKGRYFKVAGYTLDARHTSTRGLKRG